MDRHDVLRAQHRLALREGLDHGSVFRHDLLRSCDGFRVGAPGGDAGLWLQLGSALGGGNPVLCVGRIHTLTFGSGRRRLAASRWGVGERLSGIQSEGEI